MKTLRDFGNAVLLCGLCHANLDLREPRLIFFPTDISWFVDFEDADFELRRTDFLETGKLRRRRPPTKADYENGGEASLLYTRASIGNWHPRIAIEEQATWDGDPMTAFQSSFRALGDERLDLATRQSLINYSLLLDRHDAESSQWATSSIARKRPRPDSSADAENALGEDADEHNDDVNANTHRQERSKRGRVDMFKTDGSIVKERVVRGLSDHCASEREPHRNIVGDEMDLSQRAIRYTYGPSFTAGLCVSYMMKLRQRSRKRTCDDAALSLA